jgi:ectoine hydroxylase-related dioxygenase (phytanoyl-CoA dioxygenase family)
VSIDDAVAHDVAALARDGYSIRHDVLTTAECDELLATIDAMAGTWGRSLIQSFHGYRTVRYFDLLNAAPVFRSLPAHPQILPVARAVLGKDCLLSTYGTVAIGPGEPAQAIHADDVLYRLPRPHGDIFCNVMIALSDFTEENGATRIVPGSHRWPDDPEIRIMPEGEVDTRWASIPAVMPQGSVCFFLGGTYHGGGANRTRAPRTGMTMAYCAGWLRPQENYTVAVRQELAATFEPDLQAVMGWRTANGGALGRVYTEPDHFSGPLVERLVPPDAPVREAGATAPG